MEEFCQSANHIHDANRNKKNNDEGESVLESSGEIISDLIDLEASNKDTNKNDNDSPNASDKHVVIENLNLKNIK